MPHEQSVPQLEMLSSGESFNAFAERHELPHEAPETVTAFTHALADYSSRYAGRIGTGSTTHIANIKQTSEV